MDYQKKLLSCCNNIYTYDGWETNQTIMNTANDEKEALMTGLRKGPWTAAEDSKLTSAVVIHGVGGWNNLANLAGLKRSGKSCRLRWLNYLRPDLRRGGFTLDEQLLILELHLRWGNRWSKIAENLPGRTDNEIKNFWRTKVQKLARQFQCNVNSFEFNDALRNIWIPILVEQIQASARPTSITVKAQSEGPSFECEIGPKSTYSSSSSEDRSLSDTSATWAQTSLDQHLYGPVDLFSKPNNFTYSCEAHISPECGSSIILDPYLEHNSDYMMGITNYDADDMLFLHQQLDYLA